MLILGIVLLVIICGSHLIQMYLDKIIENLKKQIEELKKQIEELKK